MLVVARALKKKWFGKSKKRRNQTMLTCMGAWCLDSDSDIISKHRRQRRLSIKQVFSSRVMSILKYLRASVICLHCCYFYSNVLSSVAYTYSLIDPNNKQLESSSL